MDGHPQQILDEAMRAAGFGEEKKELYRRRLARALLVEIVEAEKLFAGTEVRAPRGER